MGAHIIKGKQLASPPAAVAQHRESRAILDGIRRVVRTLRESSRAAEQRVGITGAQLFVLQRLAASPALSINELAALTLTHQSSVSVVVSRLNERSLIRRIRSKKDQRRTEIALTAQGKALLKKAPGAAQDRLIAGLEKMRPEQRHALASGLESLVDAMDIRDSSPSMFFESDV